MTRVALVRLRRRVPRGIGRGTGPGPPAQAAPAAATPPSSPIPPTSPFRMEIMVNKPAAEVWKRIGKYCDIGEWFQIPCTITQGKDGEFGAVRSVANEVLVGKTELSYTYTQPVRAGRPYILYHGTLEARPVTATTSKLVYTLVYDNSTLGDDARQGKGSADADGDVHARAAEHEDDRRRRHAASSGAARRRRCRASGAPPAGGRSN